jgi:hypothetical protein
LTRSPSADDGRAADGVAARHLDLRYDAVEDRLLLTARSDEEAVDLLLSRRLTRRLLGGMLDLLMRTSVAVGRSSGDHRGDVLLFEHVAALDRLPPPGAAPDPDRTKAVGGPGRRQPLLASRVDISLGPDGMRLSLWVGSSQTAWMQVPRDQAHLLLDMLLSKAREAEWDLNELGWIDRRGHYVRPGGVLAS